MAESVELADATPEVTEEPAEEVAAEATEPQAAEPEATVEEAEEPTAPLSLPENWDDDPRFRSLKSWVDTRVTSQVKTAVGQAVAQRDKEWQDYIEPVRKQLETAQTEGMTAEELADYYKAKATDMESTFTQWRALEQKRVEIATKYGVPLDRLSTAAGEAGLMEQVIAFIQEQAAAPKETPAAVPPRVRREAKQPPKVAKAERTVTTPSGLDAYKALSLKEKGALHKDPKKLLEFIGGE